MPSLKLENNPNWKGGFYKDQYGHNRILFPSHNRADSKGYIKQSILIAEKSLGKPLPNKAVVHHHTEKQLVVCENQAYHMLLHQRTRAYRATGNANSISCEKCRKYLSEKHLSHRKIINFNEVPCECGCGLTIITPDSRGRLRRFISGHNVHPRGNYAH